MTDLFNAGALYQSASEIYGILRGRNEAKPPVPKRGSSLERPSDSNIGASGSAYPAKTKKCSKGQKHDANGKDVPVPDFNQSSPDMSKIMNITFNKKLRLKNISVTKNTKLEERKYWRQQRAGQLYTIVFF